jgi:hypothetical protein
MMTRVEQDKSRMWPPTKKRESSTSYIAIISLVVSVGAFILSSVVTIMGTFRVSDHILIAERGLPVVTYRPSTSELVTEAPGEWVITNLGNRPAVIGYPMVVLFKDQAKSDDCDVPFLQNSNMVGWEMLDLKPFIIEPNKIEIKKITMLPGGLLPVSRTPS